MKFRCESCDTEIDFKKTVFAEERKDIEHNAIKELFENPSKLSKECPACGTPMKLVP